MARTPIAYRPSDRFFFAFHRYLAASPVSCQLRPRVINLPPERSQRPSPSPYACQCHASTSSSIPTPPPTPSRTHYSMFPHTVPSGPPPGGHFDIDPSALRREFLQLQASAHPDRHSGPNKRKAEGTSALINEAYKTLQNPLRRAQYLLSLRGIDIAEDERAKTEDMDLLEEVMEVRSLIEGAEDQSELEETRDRNDQRIKESERVLGQAFARENIESAKQEAVRLRYWINIKESLDSWEKGKPVVLVH